MVKIPYPVRINRYLALKNIATRRAADDLIARGLVTINGKTASLGDQVRKGDTVEVAAAQDQDHVYYAYHKPVGIVTSLPHPGEQGILDVAAFPEKVFPVGRLDKDSSGLILLTNDGRITDKLLNPRSFHEKEYRVKVDKDITNTFLKFMKEGVRMGTFVSRPAKVRKISSRGFDIVLTEGKNRQIRRMCASLGFGVKDLKRIRVAGIELGSLKAGAFRKIEGRELESFLSSLGI